MQVVSAFLSFLVFSMSGSSNDHVLRDGARPDEMDDIFSTLSHRQLNVLYGVPQQQLLQNGLHGSASRTSL